MDLSPDTLSNDLLVHKAVIINNALQHLPESKTGETIPSTLEDTWPLQTACDACIDMGTYFIKSRSLGKIRDVPDVFQKLVEHQVIEASLSRRLLSLISFGKILKQRGNFKGKNFRLYLKKTAGRGYPYLCSEATACLILLLLISTMNK